MDIVEQSQAYPNPARIDHLYSSREGKLVHLEDRKEDSPREEKGTLNEHPQIHYSDNSIMT